MGLTRKLYVVTLALQLCFVLHVHGSSSAPKAVQLLNYDEQTNRFVLNPDGLELMRRVSGPMQVISAVGDARVGKSTAMNIVQHLWNNRSPREYTDVFETGGTLAAVTRGVWISVVHGNDGMERVILDVEGTDLGDDSVTDQLSIFTALMSSGMAFFMRDAVKTHSVDFLFRVSRLSDIIFKNETIKNFPQLRVILRGALATPPGIQMEDYVKKALVDPDWGDMSDKKREAIAKHFPGKRIEVSAVEEIEDLEIFEDFKRLSKTDYMKSMELLAENLKRFPVKKTAMGGLMDGETLAELAVKLVEAMASNAWHDFGNVYLMVETHLCDRRFQDIVQPQLKGNAQAMKRFLGTGFERFAKECAIEKYVTVIKAEVVRIMKTKEDLEQKQKNLVIEINKLKAEKTKRLQAEAQFIEEKEKMSKELTEEKAKGKRAAQEADRLKKQYETRMEEIASLEREIQRAEERLREIQNSDNGGFFGFFGKIIETIGTIVFAPIALPLKAALGK